MLNLTNIATDHNSPRIKKRVLTKSRADATDTKAREALAAVFASLTKVDAWLTDPWVGRRGGVQNSRTLAKTVCISSLNVADAGVALALVYTSLTRSKLGTTFRSRLDTREDSSSGGGSWQGNKDRILTKVGATVWWFLATVSLVASTGGASALAVRQALGSDGVVGTAGEDDPFAEAHEAHTATALAVSSATSKVWKVRAASTDNAALSLPAAAASALAVGAASRVVGEVPWAQDAGGNWNGHVDRPRAERRNGNIDGNVELQAAGEGTASTAVSRSALRVVVAVSIQRYKRRVAVLVLAVERSRAAVAQASPTEHVALEGAHTTKALVGRAVAIVYAECTRFGLALGQKAQVSDVATIGGVNKGADTARTAVNNGSVAASSTLSQFAKARATVDVRVATTPVRHFGRRRGEAQTTSAATGKHSPQIALASGSQLAVTRAAHTVTIAR